MPQVQNSDAIQAIRDSARLSISEGFPQMLSNTIVPILDMTPRVHRLTNQIRSASSTSTGTTTPYTTSATKETYLTYLSADYIKDSSNNMASGGTSITVTTEDGVVRAPMFFSFITLTAQSEEKVIHFNPPLKLAKGTQIDWGVSFTLGVMVRTITLGFFEIEP